MSKINQLVLSDPEKLLEGIGIELSDCTFIKNEIRSRCPIHDDADNDSAFCFYTDMGNWKCYTRCCEKNNGSNAIGLVMSKFKCDINKAISMIYKIYGIKKEEIEDLKLLPPYRDLTFINNQKPKESDFKPISIEKFDEISTADDEYFPKKGFSQETISKFRISKCKELGKPMYNRAFVPCVDDETNKIVGFTGRWMEDKMPEYIPKWKHYGIKTTNNLYNLDRSKNFIEQSGSVIILEGPKEIWRLDESGIFNTIAGLGLSISPIHIKKLISYDCKKVYICYNNDKAGVQGAIKTAQELKEIFNVEIINDIRPEKIDLDEMMNEEVAKLFGKIK